MLRKRNRLNKKGDVPVMILVIGVVVICILTIFSFVGFKKLNGNDLESGLPLFEQAQADLVKFKFYTNQGIDYSKADAAKMIGARIVGDNLIIEKSNERVSFVYNVSIGPG